MLASGRYYNYSELTVLESESTEVEEGAVSEAMSKAIAASVEAMLPEILADDCKPLTQDLELINGEAEQASAPAPTQWQAERAKLTELLQALKTAQLDIERLTSENLKLHAANSDLHNEIAHLKDELAALK